MSVISKAMLNAAAGAVAGGWNISEAVYTGRSFSVSAQDLNPFGMFFKPDGTKMFILGYTGKDVNEYSLSTPLDISTASYAGRKSISSYESYPTGMYFTPDGTGMYVVGTGGDEVNQFSLSTAWDISTLSYVRRQSITEDSSIQGIFFKPDGTKMYISGDSNNNIYEYSLSTAWDVSTESYTQSYNVATEDDRPRGIFFKPDGTYMYVVGNDTDYINQYILSTAWDISTASYEQQYYGQNEDNTPNDIYISDDGSKMYMIGVFADKVYEYDL
jgi:DNA-binding beta-propeller fold protein YncE